VKDSVRELRRLVNFRADADQIARWKRAAAADGRTFAGWARRELDRAAERKTP
jgi:hypothetical protein